MKIDEIIVVEGRDDTEVVKRAVDCETIETHGFGISKETWKKLDTAYERKGLIILTDPDHAGSGIRSRLIERYPESIEAFLPRSKASKSGDIGVENADPKDVEEALKKALSRGDKSGKSRKAEADSSEQVTQKDFTAFGLSGREGSRARREKLAEVLGIGYGNSRAMLSRIKSFGITRDEFMNAVEELE